MDINITTQETITKTHNICNGFIAELMNQMEIIFVRNYFQ